jgi:hypothetical protein
MLKIVKNFIILLAIKRQIIAFYELFLDIKWKLNFIFILQYQIVIGLRDLLVTTVAYIMHKLYSKSVIAQSLYIG